MNARATTTTLLALASARAIDRERRARRHGQQALAAGQITDEQLQARIAEALIAAAATFRGEPGGPGRAPTAGEIAAAVGEYIEPIRESLRGDDGRTPTEAELLALIVRVFEQNVERLRGTPGDSGRGIASAQVDRAGDLWITYSDGDKANVGHVRGKDGKDATSTERVAVISNGRPGLNADEVLQLIEEHAGGGASAPNVRIVSADTNVTADDDVLIVTAAATVTLMPAADRTRVVRVKRFGSGNVVVAAQSGELIDGADSWIINTQYDSLDAFPFGSSWARL